MLQLVIANRNYSSWSFRAWMYLVESGIEFEEIRIPLFTGQWREEIARYSPVGRAPVLIDDGFSIWDSAAIIEYVREQFTGSVDWPDGREQRARARSISAEMHSGFLALRDELPQNLRARFPLDPQSLSEECRQQIQRVDQIWSECRNENRSSGKWLFGTFSIADVMFAPVALRFATYKIDVSPVSREFIDAVCGLQSVQQWIAAAREETESISFIDQRIPARETDLTPG
jgi:glutathione S-transferase